jgi:transposase InsO family protein
MNITPAPDEVMGLVGMDYWGPTEQPTAEGNRYVVTMTDYLSKFVLARAVKTNSAQEAADFFLDVCYHYGAPTKLITDQGSHFIAELTRTIINSCNTTHVLVTPYHPRSNAQTERFNATFAPALSKLMGEEKQNWDHLLQPIIYAYNTSQHSTTALTPFNLMFGRENLLLMDPKQMKVSLSKPNEYYEKVKQSRKFIIDYAKVNIEHRNKLAKLRYNKNRPDPH